jgi:hypothetical protein
MNSALLSRLTIFATVTLTVLTSSHAIPANVSIYLVAVLAGLQAIQPPVQHSADDNAAANAAVQANQNPVVIVPKS